MAKGVFSEGSTRTIARRLVTIMTIICANQIRGFVLVPSTRIVPWVGYAARRYRTLLSSSNLYCESMSVPTVINPISKRRIHLGGTMSKENTRK